MSDYEEFDLIKIHKKMDCQVLTTGYKYVEADYYLCECDEEDISPICSFCANNCHKNHQKTKWKNGEAVCMCGFYNHIVKNENKEEENQSISCIFSDLLLDYIKYYPLKIENSKLCVYCNEFCVEKEHKYLDFDEQKISQKCQCQKHKDLKSIYKSIISLAHQSNRIRGFNLLIFSNLLFLNEIYFRMIYKDFIVTQKSLLQEISMNDFHLSAYYGSGNYFCAIENFAALVKNIKFVNYHNEKLYEFFDFTFVYKLLNSDFNASTTSLWILKNNVLLIFRKIFVHKLFNFCPFLKISDIVNMNPLQRLLILSNINDNKAILRIIMSKEFNLIEIILRLIKKFIYLDDKAPDLAIGILKNLYSICKIFAKANLMTNEQIDKLCELNDELILDFYKIDSRDSVKKNYKSYKGN